MPITINESSFLIAMNFPIINSTYNFECTMCGNCCTGDQQVNLNFYDLYKMASYKKYVNSSQLFDNQIVHLVLSQNDTWLPRIKFKAIKSNKFNKGSLVFCPFLINELDEQNNLKGLCSLHPDKKPLICSLAPVGRILDFEDGSEKYVFVKPAPDCPGVEIQKTNQLADLKKTHKKELEYEKRFYKILYSIGSKKPQSIFKELYSFSVIRPFEEILIQMEMKFL